MRGARCGCSDAYPQVTHDTLQIVSHGPKVAFEFKTDLDRIAFEIPANSVEDFYAEPQ